jgi:beta-lactamase class A
MPLPNATRRRVLRAAAAVSIFPVGAARAALPAFTQLAALEQQFGRRLGVAAIDTGSGKLIEYRADERFAFCSTFKMVLAAAILARSTTVPGLLNKRLHFQKRDLLSHSPITGTAVETGMTVAELCDCTVRYSDNTAANLLIDTLGGTAAVTAFARSLGDTTFRLDRRELELNSAIPGDLRDTTSPGAMLRTVRKLVLGDGLPAPQQQMLKDWMVRNTTGNLKIRAGVPKDWLVADKTGAGAYGASNDIGVVWPPGRAPIVLSIYTVGSEADADSRNDLVAAAANVVATAF